MSDYQRLHAQVIAQHKQRQRVRIEAQAAVLEAIDTLDRWEPELWSGEDLSRIERARRALQQLLDQHVLG